MKKNICLLEHSKFERDKVKYVLGKIGEFNFIDIADEEALKVFLENGEQCDLFIVEICFPTEAEGFKALYNLREADFLRDIPIIITTRLDAAEHKVHAHKLRVSDYVVKPYKAERLESSIKNLLQLEEPFTYRINTNAKIVMTLEEYISKEVKIADRTERPLSIIVTTPAKLRSINPVVNDKIPINLREEIYTKALECAKVSLRVTDTVFVNDGRDIIILLPGSDKNGAAVVNEKIKRLFAEALNKMEVKYDDYFYTVSVTFPEEGKDFISLMESAFRKVSDKEILEHLAGMMASTKDYAHRLYKKFNK